MFKTLKTWIHAMTAPACTHRNFKVRSKIGPTSGRHKIWNSCQCTDCGQWFVYEELSGKRFMMDGPGFGFQKI